ncbi:MAG: ABC-F family ATP-binding cassette domain-containing protein [Sphingomonadales bacterium]
MHFVSVENLSKSYGIHPLFSSISFHISQGDKIALIARNGSGKSTLLRILAGQETADTGTVWINKEVDVILFEQDPAFDAKKTVAETIFFYDHPLMNAVRAYEAAAAAPDGLLLNEAIVKMDELGAWDVEAKVKQILDKLNIKELHQPMGTLSGGQRKRVALAKTLIDIGFEHKHCLLIMDEPTNHLDVAMVEWMEQFLNRENLTLIVVTHDRYFLDIVCEEIWELDGSELYSYKGNYENYLEKKSARIESDKASVDKARNLYRRELEWMRKQPKARTTKSKSRQDNFYQIAEKASKQTQDTTLQLSMKMSRLGGKVIELKKIYKSYGDTIILKGFDYTFKKGERVGIIGANGVGKSTFTNILQGIEAADSGKINVGDTIVFGNYSQQGLQLKDDQRVIEFVKNIAENFPLASGGSLSAAQFLQLFLFDPDKQYTYISKLSGGEKRRLHLLSILFRNPNFLILDEPTHDLDLPTLAVLENFLLEFGGCLVIISHDRYFMDRLVDHLLVFEGNGTIRDFPGHYSQYRLESGKKEVPEKKEATTTSEYQERKETSTANDTTPLEKRPLSYKEKREFEQLEKELPLLNEEKRKISEELASGNCSYEQLTTLSLRIEELTVSIDSKELRWLELSERS